ncbi:DUF5689 domain-containing protein [Maribacter sp. 2210JD10-5]|uniref:DUF5689 domain-containing protein n=1 Tax=Maribacter sp. 2210JD10-5 TaxID=3386272 RepID=UPI0039BD8D86
MEFKVFKIHVFGVLVSVLLCVGCVKNRSFDAPEITCSDNVTANTTYAEVKSLFNEETVQIQEDLIIEGYISSSDKAGNFFSVLYFQDSPVNPTEGFQIEIDLRDSHLFYGLGQKVFIKLKGLYLGKSKGVFKLGGVFSAFGNISVGRLPSAAVADHIFVSCDVPAILEPNLVSIEGLNENLTNTLVQFMDMEISEAEIGEIYAVEREETERTLIDCNDNELTLLNSGFSDFQAEILPEGRGSITGVLLRENDDYLLVVRDLEDINFNQERCEDLIDEFTSRNIFISELADPDNNVGARFVELYNSSDSSLSLKGWRLERYTNASTTVSSFIDLSDYTIAAESTFIISPNTEEFEIVYGFIPDLGIGTNSPADSNGDDNLQLVDPFGEVIDVFGRIGEDGTNTDHEFEDGRAVRNINILNGNPVFTFSEWTIFNDTGNAGTTNEPQSAPEDFNPGVRGI